MSLDKSSKISGTVLTKWQVRTYDVWGNDRDGYTVNDSHDRGEVELLLPLIIENPGTESEFVSAFPSDRQIKDVFGCHNNAISVEGDDVSIIVERTIDGYPIGEMFCTSHDSLSPVRAKGVQ